MVEFSIPKKLKIGAHQYIISRDNSNLPDGETAGYHEPNRNRITIAPNQPHTQELVSLIHELIHAINSELSEETAETLAQGFAGILVDNKIIKFIPDERIRRSKKSES